MNNPKILLWDIESTGLNATFGTILCIGWKWHNQRKVTVDTILEHRGSIEARQKNMLDDSGVVERFAETFREADYHITWYGAKYDLPMVQTKLMKYGLPPLPTIPHLDLWYHARYKMRLHNNRLATVSEYLGVAHRKSPLVFDDWLHAAHGDAKAIATVKEHCRLDCLVLEEVFDKMRPFLHNEPARQLYTLDDRGNCPACGVNALKKQGFKTTPTRKYQRYQCTNCGKWSRKRLSEKTSLEIVGGA